MNFLDERLPDRFWAKCIPEPNSGCWLWIGCTNPLNGYGQVWNGKRQTQSHRFSYLSLVGPIPSGLEIDHFVCSERTCCNPAHLKAVTHRANTLRSGSFVAANSNKVACPQGHPYNEVNTRLNRGSRQCRVCHRERARRSRAA